MIGHKIYQSLSSRDFRLIITSRKAKNKLPYIFNNSDFIPIDILDNSIEPVLDKFFQITSSIVLELLLEESKIKN